MGLEFKNGQQLHFIRVDSKIVVQVGHTLCKEIVVVVESNVPWALVNYEDGSQAKYNLHTCIMCTSKGKPWTYT